MPSSVPANRLRVVNQHEVRAGGAFVLYWMIASRRPFDNYALDHAVAYARELDKPLVILEALRCGYAWASDRMHSFVIEGMREHAHYFARKPVTYYPYIEPAQGAGSGLLEALAAQACLVITDDSPGFFMPRMVAAAGRRLSTKLVAVDSCGLLPLALAEGRSFVTAYSFRRFMQHNLLGALSHMPAQEALKKVALKPLAALPRAVTERWPRADPQALAEPATLLASLPIDHGVAPVTVLTGGFRAAEAQLTRFVRDALPRYGEERSHPDAQAASGLSPWLHFGHIGTHRVLQVVAEAADWDGMPRGDKRNGSREGFWGIAPSAEAFLDELITWRELCFNTAHTLADYEQYGSLPEWAKKTLAQHAGDDRPRLYDLATLEQARTYDPVWNAAQRELVLEGRMQNYLRMLWAKKILEWSRTPEEAIERALHLNNKYAIDGRDPNSYGGVFWTFGRYDRPWAPERPIFGVIRYMSSDSTLRKLRLKRYLAQHGGGQLALGDVRR